VRALIALLAVLALAGCGGATAPELVPGSDADHGRSLIEHYGCGSCHVIPGVERAQGRVGPPLDDFREHRFIAGEIPNTRTNLERWIRHPHQIEPGTIMPELGVSSDEARDIAAYLYGHT
jgi:cytochrome c